VNERRNSTLCADNSHFSSSSLHGTVRGRLGPVLYMQWQAPRSSFSRELNLRTPQSTIFPWTEKGKNVGAGVIGYLQQPPSQQAGFPQQATTVAARADNEMKRTAANANTSTLSFIKMISFKNAA